MGVLSEETDLNSLRLEVERMRERYYNLPFSKISLGAAVQEILDLAYKYRIRIPSEFTLLAKALLTLEGVVQELDPELSIMVLAEPFGRELFRKKYSPGNIGKHLSEVVEDYGEIALALPKRIDHILSKLEEGKLSLKLEHQNIEKALNRADRISNKLTFAIVLLSFSIVMSGLIIGYAIEGDTGGFFLWRLPILEVGFGAASMMFLWLILAILRSGRF
jgi:ubiquinone biosynthesis protein